MMFLPWGRQAWGGGLRDGEEGPQGTPASSPVQATLGLAPVIAIVVEEGTHHPGAPARASKAITHTLLRTVLRHTFK